MSNTEKNNINIKDYDLTKLDTIKYSIYEIGLEDVFVGYGKVEGKNVTKDDNQISLEVDKKPYNPIEKKQEENSVINNELAFDPKHYATNKDYGVALSTLQNKDMPRPKENVRWIRSLTINYPQLYNLQDVNKEERINDTLFKEALNIRDIINHRDYIEYNIDYEIMEVSDKYLSIIFTGLIHSSGRTNRVAYAVTINLSDGKFMELSEFYKIDKNFISEHLHKDFVVAKNNFNNINDNNAFVEKFINEYNKNKHEHDFYIKNGTLGLIIPASQSMAYIILEGKIKQ